MYRLCLCLYRLIRKISQIGAKAVVILVVILQFALLFLQQSHADEVLVNKAARIYERCCKVGTGYMNPHEEPINVFVYDMAHDEPSFAFEITDFIDRLRTSSGIEISVTYKHPQAITGSWIAIFIFPQNRADVQMNYFDEADMDFFVKTSGYYNKLNDLLTDKYINGFLSGGSGMGSGGRNGVMKTSLIQIVAGKDEVATRTRLYTLILDSLGYPAPMMRMTDDFKNKDDLSKLSDATLYTLSVMYSDKPVRQLSFDEVIDLIRNGPH